MRKVHTAFACMAIVFGLWACSGSKNTPVPTPPATTTPIADKNWSFETSAYFADEFDNAGKPDAAKWGYDIGAGGWGNNELEYYTDGGNAAVANGKLTITAKKENVGGAGYTSARMVSKGVGSMLYGRVEVRAKLPSGVGTWPAIWMLPDDYAYGPWPKSGEIDLMEMVGFDPNMVHFTVHNQTYNGANGKGAGKTIATASTDYHVYRIDWTPYAIKSYFDGELIYTYVNDSNGFATWPYDKKFHLLLNIAVGGSWGGQKGVDDTAFPTSMDIDYVRFYKMIDK